MDVDSTEDSREQQGVEEVVVGTITTASEALCEEEVVDSRSQETSFKFGSQVIIQGLTSAPSYNDKIAFICGDQRKENDRWPLRVANTTEVVLLKSVNFTVISVPIPGLSVEEYIEQPSDSDDDSNLDTSSEDSDGSDNDDQSSDLLSEDEDSEIDLEGSEVLSGRKLSELAISQSANSDSEEGLLPRRDRKSWRDGRKPEWLEKCDELLRKWTEEAPRGEPTPSLVSTKSIESDCGLRWAPEPITEDITLKSTQLIGKVVGIVEGNQIIVESLPLRKRGGVGPRQKPLSYESILCLEDKTILGRIDDIIGSIKKPNYLVRLTHEKARELIFGGSSEDDSLSTAIGMSEKSDIVMDQSIMECSSEIKKEQTVCEESSAVSSAVCSARISYGTPVHVVSDFSSLLDVPRTDERYSSDSAAEYEEEIAAEDQMMDRRKPKQQPERGRFERRTRDRGRGGSSRGRGRGAFNGRTSTNTTRFFNDEKLVHTEQQQQQHEQQQEQLPEQEEDFFDFLM